MTIFAFVGSLLSAIAAIPKIAEYVKQFAGAVTLWWVEQQTEKSLAMIADAAAMSSRAKSKEERYAAIEKWREALSRPRVSP